MTIISTHRSHSYKVSASLHRRDVSPKKISIRRTSFDKTYSNKQAANIFSLELALKNIDTTKFLPTLMTDLTDYMTSFQYKVLTPTEYEYEEDIVVEDTNLDEDDMEKAWAHYDYLEWLSD